MKEEAKTLHLKLLGGELGVKVEAGLLLFGEVPQDGGAGFGSN